MIPLLKRLRLEDNMGCKSVSEKRKKRREKEKTHKGSNWKKRKIERWKRC